MPLGKFFANSVSFALTADAVSRAFAPGARRMAIAEAGWLSRRAATSYSCAPSSTRATSLTNTVLPSALARTITLANSSRVLNLPLDTIIALSCCPSMVGSCPSSPVASWIFCARMARATSPGDRLKASSRSGFSQMRIEYSVPNKIASPTPLTRRMLSSTLAAA